MSKEVHAAAFGGYDYNAAVAGAIVERDAPLCKAPADDPDLSWKDSEITCGNCRRMLGLNEPKEAP